MARLVFAGFDVREDHRRPSPEWNDERRRLYLLRRDVLRPLSVDAGVWRQTPGAGPRLPWVSVDDLRAANVNLASPYEILAVGIVAAMPDDEAAAAMSGWETELAVDRQWRPLGHDVADAWGTSGLSNCGYTDEAEAFLPRATWGSCLNQHGLFDDVEHALAFRELTNRRVPEHAPFLVYSLWLV